MKTTSKVDEILEQEKSTHAAKLFGWWPEKVLLADVSVKELGLPDHCPYRDILFKGASHSVVWQGKPCLLAPALATDAITLRLSYEDQPKDEWLRVAMEAINHPMGNKVIFRLVHGKNGVRYLDTDDGGDYDDVFDDHVRFLWRLMPVRYVSF